MNDPAPEPPRRLVVASSYQPKEGQVACFGKMLWSDVVAGQEIKLDVWGDPVTIALTQTGYLHGISGYSDGDIIHLVPVYGLKG